MVVTVTLNPALDLFAQLDTLCPGELNRANGNFPLSPGGKGVNAAKAVHILGGDVLATGFTGGMTGGFMRELLDRYRIPHRFIPVGSDTRLNIKILDGGGMTEINAKGSAVGHGDLEAMENLITSLAAPNRIFVLSGALPPGAPEGLYARYIKLLNRHGSKVILDASGAPLRLGAAARPYLIRINAAEARDIDDGLKTGINTVISEGEKGALFHLDGERYRLPAAPVDGKPAPAGAGDMMAGALAYAIDKNMPWQEAAFLSMAAAAAAVAAPPGCIPSRQSIEACLKSTYTRCL